MSSKENETDSQMHIDADIYKTLHVWEKMQRDI